MSFFLSKPSSLMTLVERSARILLATSEVHESRLSDTAAGTPAVVEGDLVPRARRHLDDHITPLHRSHSPEQILQELPAETGTPQARWHEAVAARPAHGSTTVPDRNEADLSLTVVFSVRGCGLRALPYRRCGRRSMSSRVHTIS